MIQSKVRERNILFLCMDNSYSSQMAEAIARRLAPPHTKVFSAGIDPRPVNPAVAQVMREVEIDTSNQRLKGLESIPIEAIDLVVALGKAKEKCPALPPTAKIRYWSIPDLQQTATEEEAVQAALRYLRDELDRNVAALFLDYWRNLDH